MQLAFKKRKAGIELRAYWGPEGAVCGLLSRSLRPGGERHGERPGRSTKGKRFCGSGLSVSHFTSQKGSWLLLVGFPIFHCAFLLFLFQLVEHYSYKPDGLLRVLTVPCQKIGGQMGESWRHWSSVFRVLIMISLILDLACYKFRWEEVLFYLIGKRWWQIAPIIYI